MNPNTSFQPYFGVYGNGNGYTTYSTPDQHAYSTAPSSQFPSSSSYADTPITTARPWQNLPAVNDSRPTSQLGTGSPIAYRPRSVSPPNIQAVKKAKKKKIGGRDEKVMPSFESGGVPDPTSAYFYYSNEVPRPLDAPQHLLVVIDLNGTLLYRPNRLHPTRFTARPHTYRFLEYCANTFNVVIWSSARPENVKNMCNAILTPELRKKVVAIWGRDRFRLTKSDFDKRVQCYKRLTELWKNQEIAITHPLYAYGSRWDQTNTVLVDDSLEKGRSEPYNLIEIPEFFGDENEQGGILPQVHDYLNHLSMHANVSACLRAQPFRPKP